MAFWIILSGFWLSPLLSYIFLSITENRKKIRTRILLLSFLLTFLTIIGLLTHISTTSSFFDWLMLSNIYLTTSLTLWWTQFQPIKYLKIIGLIIMICVFGYGYTLSTIGVVRLNFIINDYEMDEEKWFEDGLICKETSFGYVFSKDRGKRVEISKTVTWLPIFEYLKVEKEYLGYFFDNNFSFDYKPNQHKVYLFLTSNSSVPSYLVIKNQVFCLDSIEIR
jgi:hypothetical protein